MGGIERGARLGGLVLRGLLVTLFLVAAGMKLTGVPFEVESFARFGYAPWFMILVGVIQLAGALLLTRRATVLPGAVLLAIVMVGAVGSHWRAGDPVAMMLPALLTLAALLGLAWASRHAPRPWLARRRTPTLARG